MSVFGLYSEYYDLLYSDKDYEGEARYVGDLIRGNAPKAKSVLELGCGTGAHAGLLAQQGYAVTGIDMSQIMLDKAIDRKARLDTDAASRLDFQQGDARTYRSDQNFDVVISLFHVFSYQNTNDDLLATFETAAQHLRPGGILIFDYWYGPSVLTQRPEVRIKRLENDRCKVLRIAEPEIFTTRNLVNVNYWMLIDSLVDGRTERITETHTMRYLFIPEIEAFSSPLFQPRSHFAWMSTRCPGFDDWAALSVLERRE